MITCFNQYVHGANERPVNRGGCIQCVCLEKRPFLFPGWWWKQKKSLKRDCREAKINRYTAVHATSWDMGPRPPVFDAATEKHMSLVWLETYLNRGRTRYLSDEA